MPTDGRHRVRSAPLQTSIGFAAATIVLMGLLGLGVVVQVRSGDGGDALDAARPADLLVVLDNVGRREAALRAEITELESTLAALEATDGGSDAALAEARDRVRSLAIGVGTIAATGPGVVVTVNDPSTGVGAEVLLDTLQELRAAGAEAIEISGAGAAPVRIGVESWVAGKAGSVIVDGQKLSAPFVFTAIGDPATLAAALDIPGGVVDTVARFGGLCDVSRSAQVDVSALRDPRSRQYSQPGN